MKNDLNREELYPKHRTKNTLKRVGIFLFIFSFIFYGIAFVAAFMPLPAKMKVFTAALFVVLGEASFWISCMIAGKELIKRYRKQLNPMYWFKNTRDKNTSGDNDNDFGGDK